MIRVNFNIPRTTLWKPFCVMLKQIEERCIFEEDTDIARYFAQLLTEGVTTYATILQRDRSDPKARLIVWPWFDGHQAWGVPSIFGVDPRQPADLQIWMGIVTEVNQGLPGMPNPDRVYWFVQDGSAQPIDWPLATLIGSA